MTDLAFNLIMDCGQAMLANGGEVFRAQDTMEIMARSFGIVDFHVYVLTNGIFASAQNGTVSAAACSGGFHQPGPCGGHQRHFPPCGGWRTGPEQRPAGI